MPRGTTHEDAGGRSSRIDLMMRMSALQTDDHKAKRSEAKKTENGTSDEWQKAGLNPPEFIRVLYKENAPDAKLGDILKDPIADYGNLLRAFSFAQKPDAIEIVMGQDQEMPVKSLVARLKEPSRGKEQKFIPLAYPERSKKLAAALEFITEGMKQQVIFPGLEQKLIRCGNLVLYHCLGPEWIAKYKETSQD